MTISTFIETPRFPISSVWQVSADDQFSTTVIRRASGAERRYLPSQYKTTTFTIKIPPDRLADARFIRNWYLAVYGETTGFRLQRSNDYLSCQQVDWLLDLPVPQVPSKQNTPAATDQPLVLLSGTAGSAGATYQLMKNYGSNASLGGGALQPYQHPIRKPVTGTIIVANGSAVTQSMSGNWSLDTTTGILTALSGFSGTPTTWGGQFDYPVRFNDKYSEDIELNRADPTELTLIELPLP